MKKTYLQPTMMVVRLQQQSIICTSPVRSVSGNANLNYDGGDNTKLYLGSSNKLYYPNAAMTIGCQRAYFQLADPSANVRAFVLNFGDGEPTSVTTPLALWRGAGGEAWYTLDGRKLVGRPTQNGIYITNGKKVVIK